MTGARPDPGRNPNREPRVALVTGASSGFGAAIAVALGALGWPVALGARRLDRLAEVAGRVEAAGGKPCVRALDVADPASVDAFVGEAEARLGPAQVVVSNAGIGRPGALPEVSLADLRAEIDTNLFGPMVLARRVLPGMLERRAGDLCFVTSLNAVLPRPLQAGYTASKAGLEALARVLQMELEGSGVRVSIVRPGPSLTEMGWDWPPAVQKRLLETWADWGVLRHHHFLDPEAVAQAVVAAVTAPPGTHLDLLQINPEKPAAGGA
jgi:NADP-dependent 3-hydroxy acid dehydrogenase YdfG